MTAILVDAKHGLIAGDRRLGETSLSLTGLHAVLDRPKVCKAGKALVGSSGDLVDDDLFLKCTTPARATKVLEGHSTGDVPCVMVYQSAVWVRGENCFAKILDPIYAVGCGARLLLTAYSALLANNIEPAKAAISALEATAKYDFYVGGPFDVVTL